MNWALFGLSVTAALFALWLISAVRARAPWQAIVVGLAFVLVAGVNSAAPVRGLIDPNYIGYAFGVFTAEKGVAVTIVAGGVFVSAAAGAFAALRRGRPAKTVVALLCVVFLGTVGAPLLTGAIADIDGNSIQFGEYLTIPGALSTALLFALVVFPFAAGLLWAAPAALSRETGLRARNS